MRFGQKSILLHEGENFLLERMENVNVEQLAHLNPDTECAAFEQVSLIYAFLYTPASCMNVLRRNLSERERMFVMSFR